MPLNSVASGNVQLQVYLRDPRNRVVLTRTTGSSWVDPAILDLGPGSQLAALHWEEGRYLRLFHRDFTIPVAVYYSDDDGQTWFPGRQPL